MIVNAVSAFAGIAGFDLALSRVGIPTVAAIEIDDKARGVIADQFPGTALFGDIQEVTGADLRAAGFVGERGLLTGGFPCQDLSVAGRRAGLAGSRSGLFFELARLADETKAQHILFENVPGLLSSHGGRDMGAVLGTLVELGYRIAWRVLDAQFFGVPQRRRRVFIVGSLGTTGVDPAEVLFEPAGSGGHSPAVAAPWQSPAAPAVVSTLQGGGRRGYRVDAEAAAGGHLIPLCATGQRTHALTSEGADASEDGTGRGTPIVTAFHLTQDPINGPVTPAISAGNRGGCATIGVQTPTAVRRLTPTECERLQGFPAGWTRTSNGAPQADSARYRQLGNAVALPVVEWIAGRLTSAAEVAA